MDDALRDKIESVRETLRREGVRCETEKAEGNTVTFRLSGPRARLLRAFAARLGEADDRKQD